MECHKTQLSRTILILFFNLIFFSHDRTTVANLEVLAQLTIMPKLLGRMS